MARRCIYSIIESPTHPDLAEVYAQAGLDEFRLTSTRKAIAQLKERAPDYVVAEFFYGYGNNYAGVNISNLDVLLFSLQKYAPNARVIVLVDKSERQYVDKLNEIIPLHAVLVQPVSGQQMEAAIGLKAGHP
jgi:DNA-binding NarL/FixJ family response regulator